MKKFYTEDKFGLIIDLRSMDSHDNHGSGIRLVNATDGVQLEIDRSNNGSGKLNCHIYTIADSQLNLLGRQLDYIEF